MTQNNRDMRLLIGDKGAEHELPAYFASPTWVLDGAWDRAWEVCQNALDAYMDFCESENLPHSWLLGLDIVFTGVVDPSKPGQIVDCRPVIVEGPCCNSYPACPNHFSHRLYLNALERGQNPDRSDYPVHPTEIREEVVNTVISAFHKHGGKGNPVVGVFTRPYPKSEEETAHVTMLEGFKAAGLEAYRITPEENPEVKDGAIWVNGKKVDVCYRRIERIHVPEFYGEELGNKIINETPNTVWVNDFRIDDLRSKTKEEMVFRMWEEKSGKTISRPKTLIGDEINPESVRELLQTGGFALKKWNSSGGKGVFLHLYEPVAGDAARYLYDRYDGRHMVIITKENEEEILAQFENFKEDTAIQQLRLIDARPFDGMKLVYDTRINVLYNATTKKWNAVSGISRIVECGNHIENGNSILTNVSAGATMGPLVMGHLKDKDDNAGMGFGPIITAIAEGRESFSIEGEKEATVG